MDLDNSAVLEMPTVDTRVTNPPRTDKIKSGNLLRERVLSIEHYTDKLFSFRTTRSASFRFCNLFHCLPV